MNGTLNQLFDTAVRPARRSIRILRVGYLFSVLLSSALLVTCFAVYQKSIIFNNPDLLSRLDFFLLTAIAYGAILSLAVAIIEVRMYSIRSRDQEERSAELNALLKHVTECQEREREALGEKLHDEVGGRLTAIKLELEGVSVEEEDKERLARSFRDIDAVLEITRGLSRVLYPRWIGRLGLSGALKELVERMNGGLLQIDLHVSGDVDVGLDEATGICVYRIVQEAMVNAVRHADGARRVVVRIASLPGRLGGTVDDDGRGWGDCSEGLGLTLMRERMGFLNGVLRFESSPIGGARVRFEVPLGKKEDARS